MENSNSPVLIPALQIHRQIIQNMARFYVYDMSRHCGEERGWELPENGLSYTP